MFNYFGSTKIWESNKNVAIKRQKSRICRQKKKKNDEIMVQKYARRTNQLLYKQQEKFGVVIAKYRDPLHEPRKIDTKLNIGPASFYFRDRSAQQRVHNAQKQNEYLDNVPFNAHCSPAMHQFRETSSRKPMKLTPYNTTSRIMENVKSLNTNVLPSSWNLNLSLYNSQWQNSNAHKDKGAAVRQILPCLNHKLHPKSYESVHNNLLLGGLKDIQVFKHNQHDSQSIPKQKQMNLKTKKESVKFQTFYVDTEQSHRKSQGLN